jgi:hypothetical protein
MYAPHDPPSDAAGLVCATLPGPHRRRTRVPYRFRLTYCSTNPTTEGCALLWEVDGGRLPYQIALEREAGGGLRWHCTCADAVYRGEDSPDHRCKHVRGLLAVGRPTPDRSVAPACGGPALDGAAETP